MPVAHTVGTPWVVDKSGEVRVPYTHHLTGETGELVFSSTEHLRAFAQAVRRGDPVTGAATAERMTAQAIERWARLDPTLADMTKAKGLVVDSRGDVLTPDGTRLV